MPPRCPGRCASWAATGADLPLPACASNCPGSGTHLASRQLASPCASLVPCVLRWVARHHMRTAAAAEACIDVVPKNPNNFNVDNVRVVKINGGEGGGRSRAVVCAEWPCVPARARACSPAHRSRRRVRVRPCPPGPPGQPVHRTRLPGPSCCFARGAWPLQAAECTTRMW